MRSTTTTTGGSTRTWSDSLWASDSLLTPNSGGEKFHFGFAGRGERERNLARRKEERKESMRGRKEVEEKDRRRERENARLKQVS